MKLTKKNARRLKAIQKALASGKGLGGLLVGLAAATVAAGCNRPPFATAGIPANFHNEEPDIFVTEGEVPELPEPATTNAANEAKDRVPGPPGKIGPPSQNLPPLPPGQYRVKDGDTLTKIAKAHGTTVAELKQLNGFDDKRADSLKAMEIIRVPVANTNAVNESRDSALRTKGRFPLGERSERP
jgi:LysM repeat protein